MSIQACQFLVFSSLLIIGGTAKGQTPAVLEADRKGLEEILKFRDTLDGKQIDTTPLQELQSLKDLFSAMESQFPQDKKVGIQFQKEAFGEQGPRFLQTKIRFPPFPKKMTLLTALRLAISQLELEEGAYFDFRPGLILITKEPQAARYSLNYDVRDLLHKDHIRDILQKHAILRNNKVKEMLANDEVNLLLGMVAAELGKANQDASFKSLRLVNRAKLTVRATVEEHRSIHNLFAAIRGLADVAVLMNAKLVEVDQTYYQDHLAPLLKKPGDRQPVIISLPAAQVNNLEQQKILAEGKSALIPPEKTLDFLTWQRPFGYQEVTLERETRSRIGLEGVTFRVHATVSADRRFLRLKLSQDSVQLEKLSKRKIFLADEKVLVNEFPNLRERGVTNTIKIPDGGSLLMPVLFQPEGNRVWLLLASPRIWIEEEERQLRGQSISRLATGK